MDSRYRRGRAVNPDCLIAPEDETVQMTAAEITAYTAGFDNNELSGDKMYVLSMTKMKNAGLRA